MSDQTASEGPGFRGDLSETPLPEVLYTIHRYKAPGVVECAREGESRKIHIDGGNIIFATSNRIEDSLGHRLLSQGLITQAQFDESSKQVAEGTKRHGTALVEMGILEPKDLFVSVREQVNEIVWSVFEWTSGTVTFEPGRERNLEFIKLNIPTRQAILQGVRGMPDARALVARIGNKMTVLKKTEDADFYDLTLTSAEQELYDQVNGRRSLFQLTNHPGQSPSQNAKTLYAFLALHLIVVKPQKHVKVQVRTTGGSY